MLICSGICAILVAVAATRHHGTDHDPIIQHPENQNNTILNLSKKCMSFLKVFMVLRFMLIKLFNVGFRRGGRHATLAPGERDHIITSGTVTF